MKRRARTHDDRGFAEGVGGQIDDESFDLDPEVASARLGARQDTAHQLRAADDKIGSVAEMLGEQSARHATCAVGKVWERAREPLGTRSLDRVAKVRGQLLQHTKVRVVHGLRQLR